MVLSRHAFVVLTNPLSEDQEDDFNAWYDDVHVPDVLGLDGFVAAQRYRLADVQGPYFGSEHRYLCIYEIEGDPGEAMAALAAGGKTWTVSATLDLDGVRSDLYTAIGERQSAPGTQSRPGARLTSKRS